MKLIQGIGLVALALVATVGQARAQSSQSIVTSVNADRGALKIAYISRTGDRFLSRDGGMTWSAQNPGAEKSTFIASQNKDDRYQPRINYTMRSGEQVSSRDGGLTWKSLTGGTLPAPLPATPQAAPPAASPSATPDVKESKAVAAIVELTRNPTNGETSIIYHLALANHVDLGVYDQSGNLVMTVVNADQSEGMHTVAINVAKSGPGVYYCRLIVPGTTSIAKLVVTP